MRMALDGYRVGKRLRASAHGRIHLAVRESDGVEVLLKRYAGVQRDVDSRALAELEFAALRRAAGPRVPRAFEVVQSEAGAVLVLEHVPGIPLSQRIEPGPLGIAEWLELAIQLAETLIQVHAAGVLHRALAPHNVLVDATSGGCWLVEFGQAKLLGTAQPDAVGHVGSRMLGYISPEQTGRMNRGCDFRSDLYSLGATLYAAACGRAPFDAADRLELIHAHMALVPTPPAQLRSEIPEPVSRSILKLLRKEPDERYASARALHAELCSIRALLAAGGGTHGVALREAPERPQFPARLWGREREVQALHSAFDQSIQGARLVLVRGAPGSGKSALVAQLRAHVARSRGYFAAGKFEPDHERAYAGWSAALGSFAQQILLESDERLEYWGRLLREGLGAIASVLVELAPDLGIVLGEVPAVPALRPGETQARLSLALQRFAAVAATPSHPLVLFFDDLQWSDAESRVLLEELLSSSGSAALLVVAAARADGVDAGLAALLARLAQRGVPRLELELAALAPEATAEMLAAALERTVQDVRPLADRIASSLGSLPLLVRQLVEHLHQRDWLRYEHGTGWVWSPQVDSERLPDDPIALMTAKLDRLDPELRAVLRVASCFADRFDVRLFAELSGHPLATLERALVALTLEGLIAPAPSGGLRFAHDRIREASQALLAPQERARTHARIAALLLERSSEAERQERAFEIADHLNRGRAYLPAELRLRAIELNVMAAKRALGSGAAVVAASYLAAGVAVFREEDWAGHPALALELHILQATSAIQCGELERTLELCAALERRPLGLLQRAGVAALRIQVLALTRPPEEGARYALAEMRSLGVRWPLHPSYARTWLALRVMQWRLGRKGEPRIERASTFDPRAMAAILIVGTASGVMSRTDHRLTAHSACHVLQLHLRKGYLVNPGYALGAFAMHAYLVLGNAALARRHAQGALAWCERLGEAVYNPRTELTVHLMLGPMLGPRHATLAAGPPIAERAREIGDREFEHYVRFMTLYQRALGGESVPEIERELGALAESVRRSRHAYEAPERCRRVYSLLRRPSSELKGELAASDRWLAEHATGADSVIRTLWLLVLCVHRRFEQAFAQSEALGAGLHRLSPSAHVGDHVFYRGLAAAELATRAGLADRIRYATALRASLRLLRRWSRSGPDFAHMHLLLEAERARLWGRSALALELLARAAHAADEQRFPHHAALAHERRAQLLAELGCGADAGAALREASTRYRAWGAVVARAPERDAG
jgi:hypothetical protein